MAMPPLHICRLGCVDYAPALELQNTLVEARRHDDVPDTLLLLEHPPLFTCGRGGGIENLRVTRSWLRQHGFALYETNRGGNITYHGPGQVIGYPILDLCAHHPDARWYLRELEGTLIELLALLGVSAERRAGHTGVWCGDDKIAAIGVGIRHWVTMHGFALNVAPDLSHFDLIHPCGIRDCGVTSLAELNGTAPVQGSITDRLVDIFARRFAREPILMAADTPWEWLKAQNATCCTRQVAR